MKIYSLCIALFGAIMAGCSAKSEVNEVAPETFNFLFPISKDTSIVRYFVADIDAKQNIEIRSRVKGYLEKIHIDEGKKVNKGEILFSLSNQEFKEDLLVAQANTKSALAELKSKEIELNNVEMLYKNEVVSKTELERAKAQFNAAKAQHEVAKSREVSAGLNLAYTQIKAPFTGKINRINFKVGSLIDESSLITTLSDDSYFYAYFNLSEVEYLNFFRENKANKVVKLLLANNEFYKHEGAIETIESEYDSGTGTLSARALFKNEESIIKHGSTGKIVFNVPVKSALLIPQKSTFEIQDKVLVYTVNSSNTIEINEIKVQERIGNLYNVSEGLSKDSKVIFEGIQLLKEGMQITPVKVDFLTK
ncbi:MAG: efflux RND transporter periplasmic adaptor subunit [Luteibaculaceae bacterium]